MENVPMKIQRFTYDIIYYVLWIVEVILLLRFIMKLLGANPANELVAFLYSVSWVVMGPLRDMFGVASMNGMVLEPSVLIAMIFYAVLAYVLVALLRLINFQPPVSQA